MENIAGRSQDTDERVQSSKKLQFLKFSVNKKDKARNRRINTSFGTDMTINLGKMCPRIAAQNSLRWRLPISGCSIWLFTATIAWIQNSSYERPAPWTETFLKDCKNGVLF